MVDLLLLLTLEPGMKSKPKPSYIEITLACRLSKYAIASNLRRVYLRQEKKMPIRIYIWKPRSKAVDHASMTLSDETHISWWPSNKDLKKKSEKISALQSPCHLSKNLEEDIYLEDNNEPNETHSLPDDFIDEDAIREWWASFSSNGIYRVLDQNCCHVVFKALEKGGAWDFILDEDVKSRGKTLLKPIDIDALVKKLKQFLQDHRRA